MHTCITFLRKNRIFAFLLLAELVVLLVQLAGLFGEPYRLALTPDTFTNEFSSFATLTEDGSALQIYNNEGFVTDKGITFSSTPAALPSGAYEVTVEYFSCQTPDAPTFSVLQSAGSLTFSSKKTPSAVHADTLTLDDGHRSVTTRLWISSGARLSDFCATLQYDEGQLYLYSITFTEQPIYRVTRLFCFAIFFAAIDFLFWLLFATIGSKGVALRKSLRIPLLLVGITVIACLPSFSNQLYYGHDLWYHLQRISAMAEEISYGQFPVRLTTTTLNGYGYANPLCYCELFLLLPALLYNLWLPLRTCYQVYIFAVTLAACVFSYLCFAKMTESRRGGVLGAALYTLSLYRLVCVYFRAALGEYTAMSFLPLVLLGVYEMYRCEKPRFSQWVPLAFGMAALVQSHLISTELTALLLLLFCLLTLKRTLQPARLAAWCKAAVLAFGLSAWFLLPFISTALSTNLQVNNPSVGKPQQDGLYLMQLVNPLGVGFGGSMAGTSNDMSLTLGLSLVAGLVLVAWCLWNRERQPLSFPLRVTTGFGLLAAVLTLQIFPWDFVESWLGHTVGKLAGTFQYPWRFLSLATLLLCAATLLALRHLQVSHRPEARRAAVVLVLCLAITTGYFQMQMLDVTELTANTVSRNATREVGVGEYMIDGCSIYETIWAQPKPGSDDLTLTNYEKIEGTAYVSVENTGAETTISVPIFNYGHYIATDVETGADFPIQSGENARIVLTIPADYTGTIAIYWQSPLWWRGSEVLSLVFLLGCIIYVGCGRKRRSRCLRS